MSRTGTAVGWGTIRRDLGEDSRERGQGETIKWKAFSLIKNAIHVLGVLRPDARDSIAKDGRLLKNQRPRKRQIEATEAQMHVAVEATLDTQVFTHPSHYKLHECVCVCKSPPFWLRKATKMFLYPLNPNWNRELRLKETFESKRISFSPLSSWFVNYSSPLIV